MICPDHQKGTEQQNTNKRSNICAMEGSNILSLAVGRLLVKVARECRIESDDAHEASAIVREAIQYAEAVGFKFVGKTCTTAISPFPELIVFVKCKAAYGICSGLPVELRIWKDGSMNMVISYKGDELFCLRVFASGYVFQKCSINPLLFGKL